MYSDVKLNLHCQENNEYEELAAHKCILSTRSTTLSDKLFEEEASEKLDLSFENLTKKNCFMRLVQYIYTGEITFPNDPIEVFEI